jgi:hypothetical protein
MKPKFACCAILAGDDAFLVSPNETVVKLKICVNFRF